MKNLFFGAYILKTNLSVRLKASDLTFQKILVFDLAGCSTLPVDHFFFCTRVANSKSQRFGHSSHTPVPRQAADVECPANYVERLCDQKLSRPKAGFQRGSLYEIFHHVSNNK